MVATEQSFLPIAELSAYQTKWTIKARVTNKGAVRSFKSRGGADGKVFSIELLDAMGGEIRATFFTAAVDKYADILEKGKCFTFSRGMVKVANKQYNNTNHRYELTFDKQAVIEPATEDAGIETVKFNFVSLKAVAARTLPTAVDFCGIIASFEPIQSVNTKAGVELAKRELTIVDDTATSMKVTLWGDRAKQEDNIFAGNPAVVFKSVYVKEFKDSRSGSLSQDGEMIIKSNMPEAHRLQQWWAAGGSSQQAVSISTFTAGEGRGMSATQTSLAGLRLASERLGSQPENFSIVARLSLVQTRKQGEITPLHYMACQEPREGSGYMCQKRVDEQGFCAACNRAGKVAPRLTLRCQFVDAEDQAWLTTFHESATQMLGMTGEEMRTMEQAAAEKGEAAREELDQLIKAKYFAKPMNVTVRAKMGSYNGEPRTDVAVIGARPVSHGDHGRHMLKEINEMMAQLGA